MTNPARPSPAWEIIKGMTFSKSLFFKDSEGAAIDLTGWTFYIHGKAAIEDDEYIFELTNGDGITVTPLTGHVVFTVAFADTADIDVDAVQFSLSRLFNGDKSALIVGEIPVLEIA